MRDSKTLRAILIVSGLVVLGIGGATLLVPASFHGANGIDLAGNSSLLSEIRAAGGALLPAGLLILAGAFVARLAEAAALVGALVYLSYGLARLLGFALDGRPAGSLVLATVVELLLGLACAFAFVRYRASPDDGRDAVL